MKWLLSNFNLINLVCHITMECTFNRPKWNWIDTNKVRFIILLKQIYCIKLFEISSQWFFVSPIAICYLIWYSYMLYHPFLWLAEGYCIIKMLTSHNQLPVYWYESCISGVWMVRFENSPSRQMQLENRFRAFLKHHSMLWKCSIRIILGFLCGAIDFRIISIRKAMASDNNTTKSVRSIHQIYRSGLCSARSMCLCAALSTKCISK